MKERKEYLDAVKGIGDILVIWGHVYAPEYINIFIYSFHMPLFFIVSGMLLNVDENTNVFIKNKCKNLMYPYFVFSFFTILFKGLIYDWNIKATNNMVKNTLNLTGVNAVYFLIALLFGEIIAFCLIKILKKDNKKICCIIPIFMALASVLYNCKISFLSNNVLQTPCLVIGRFFIATVFILIGYEFHFIMDKIEGLVQKRKECFVVGTASTVCLIVCLICSKYNSCVDYFHFVMNNQFLYFLFGTLSSLFLIITIRFFNILGKNKILSYYGRNSIIMLVTQQTFGLTDASASIANSVETRSLIDSIIAVIICVVAETIIIEIINRFMPFLITIDKTKIKNKMDNGGFQKLFGFANKMRH